ncbi:MAG: hypothetical protein JWN23_1559 [Rhodocyclales bacterium]|nr:hypothetical protein [Rhodocyclales bacterium]
MNFQYILLCVLVLAEMGAVVLFVYVIVAQGLERRRIRRLLDGYPL